jgi:hypothetical protein
MPSLWNTSFSFTYLFLSNCQFPFKVTHQTSTEHLLYIHLQLDVGLYFLGPEEELFTRNTGSPFPGLCRRIPSLGTSDRGATPYFPPLGHLSTWNTSCTEQATLILSPGDSSLAFLSPVCLNSLLFIPSRWKLFLKWNQMMCLHGLKLLSTIAHILLPITAALKRL